MIVLEFVVYVSMIHVLKSYSTRSTGSTTEYRVLQYSVLPNTVVLESGTPYYSATAKLLMQAIGHTSFSCDKRHASDDPKIDESEHDRPNAMTDFHHKKSNVKICGQSRCSRP
jgi:hypothetical protein